MPVSRIALGETLYGDYLFSGLSIGRGVSAPTWKTFKDSQKGFAFQGSGGLQEGQLEYHIEHNYKAASTLTLHVHWSHNVASPTGNVVWQAVYMYARGYEVEPYSAESSLEVVHAAGAQYTHHITDDDSMIIAGTFEPDTLIKVRLFRDPGHVDDTFSGDAFFDHADLHHELGQIGTAERNRPFEGF